MIDKKSAEYLSAPPPRSDVPPHWLPQRHASIGEVARVVRVPHAVSPFRLLGVINGGRSQ